MVTTGAIALLISVALLQSQAAPPTQPSTQITVAVSAEEARRIRDAIRTLEAGRDPFLAEISRYLVPLVATLARPPAGALFTVGPVTEREWAIFNLGEYLAEHETAGGPIRLQIRITWPPVEPRVYTFSDDLLLHSNRSTADDDVECRVEDLPGIGRAQGEVDRAKYQMRDDRGAWILR